jgi:hypothetical protein
VKFVALANEIAIEVPNCPRPLIERAIRNAMIEFCERAKLWRIELPAINVVANQARYALAFDAPVDPPVKAIVDIRGALFDGRDLQPTSRDRLDLHWHGASNVLSGGSRNVPTDVFFPVPTGGNASSWESAGGMPTVYFQPDPATIRLVPTPTQTMTGNIVVRVAVKPTRAATAAPDWLMEDWFEALCAGAKARLMQVPKKAWSEPNLALYYRRQFETACRKAHAEALRDSTRDDMTVRRTVAYP